LSVQAKSARIEIRCTQEEKARWTRQAGSRTLTDYLAYLADSDGSGANDPPVPVALKAWDFPIENEAT